MEEIKVSMLGGFSVSYQSKPLELRVRGQSRTLQLFQLLMLHREGVSKEKLADALYELDQVNDQNRSINNLVYRLRRQLVSAGLPEAEYVQVKNGVCIWNEEIPVYIDVEQFERGLEEAEKSEDETVRVSRLLSAWYSYRGELLPQQSHESWAIVESVRLKQKYEHCVRTLGELLKARRNYKQMYEVYTAAARIYPYEQWETGQIDSLILMGQPDVALSVYNDALKRYSEELGVAPTQRILDNFQQMRRNLLQEDSIFYKIKERLTEDPSASGAYFCNFFSFVDVYRVLCRVTERSGQSAFLMSCVLSQVSGDKEKKNFSLMEEWLKQVLCKSLRRGDLCTRYSRNRYLMLLMGMSQEDGQCSCASAREPAKSNFF